MFVVCFSVQFVVNTNVQYCSQKKLIIGIADWMNVPSRLRHNTAVTAADATPAPRKQKLLQQTHTNDVAAAAAAASSWWSPARRRKRLISKRPVAGRADLLPVGQLTIRTCLTDRYSVRHPRRPSGAEYISKSKPGIERERERERESAQSLRRTDACGAAPSESEA